MIAKIPVEAVEPDGEGSRKEPVMLSENSRNDMKKILFEEDQIQARVAELGAQLTEDFRGKKPLMVCVLRGAAFFFTDLCRKMDVLMDLDFISVSSYGYSRESTGAVRLVKDISIDVTDRHVIIVEDIVDSGLTLQYLTKLFRARGAASVSTVAFLDKIERRTVDLTVDYRGFVIPNEFVVGYGLDYDDFLRNLPYIGVMKEEFY